MQYSISFHLRRNLRISYSVTTLTLFIMIMIPTNSVAQDTEKTLPKKIIFETDMCFDVDDVGALAVLHTLADNGEAEILAISFKEHHQNGSLLHN